MKKNKDSIIPLIQREQLPQHIAIIMDGNGRWAARKGLPRTEGHKAGADTVDKIIRSCIELGTPVLSLYAFSTENWKRPDTEVKALFELLNFFINKKINTMVKNGISLRVSGDISRLPSKSRKLVEDGIKKTQSLKKLILNICINYGSRDEIQTAVEKLIKKRLLSGDLTKLSTRPEWAEIAENLYTAGLPDIDLLIRTAGEQRLSNFMLVQAAYSELFFSDSEWPDFSSADLYKAILEFQKRTRKFGGLTENLDTEKIHE